MTEYPHSVSNGAGYRAQLFARWVVGLLSRVGTSPVGQAIPERHGQSGRAKCHSHSATRENVANPSKSARLRPLAPNADGVAQGRNGRAGFPGNRFKTPPTIHRPPLDQQPKDSGVRRQWIGSVSDSTAAAERRTLQLCTTLYQMDRSQEGSARPTARLLWIFYGACEQPLLVQAYGRPHGAHTCRPGPDPGPVARRDDY